MQKANATAADQAAKAKRTVSTGLKNLVSQAGTALGQVLQSSPQPPALPDETISSNQRLATALSKRRGIGDLPRFTTDAINTDPAKAIPEIADLLRQVHVGDPKQAQDLFHQTAQGITPAQCDQLSRLWHNPWGITEFPEKREHGQRRHAFDEKPFDERTDLPDDGMFDLPDNRTLELRPEDQIDDRSKISNLLYRPDQDKHEVMKLAAQAGSESHDAGSPSADSNTNTHSYTDAHYNRDLSPPGSHADQIEGADEHLLKVKDGLAALDEANATIDAGKKLSREDADKLKSRMDEAFRFDEDAQQRARAMTDALKSGNFDDIKTLQRDLGKLANDPERQKARMDTLDYYRRTTPEQRLKNADDRGAIRGRMEDNVRVLLANQAGIAEQATLIERHQKAAKAGDPNARQIVDRAHAKQRELETVNHRLSATVAEDAGRYQSVPALPHPKVDKKGARQENDAENRQRTQKDLAVDAGLAVAGVGAAAAGRKVIGTAAASASMAMAKGAAAYTRALRDGTAAAMRKDGVDFARKEDVGKWVRENPELSQQLHTQALQAAVAEGAGTIAGDAAGKLVSNPLGSIVTKKAINEAVDKALRPREVPGKKTPR